MTALLLAVCLAVFGGAPAGPYGGPFPYVSCVMNGHVSDVCLGA